MSMQKVFWQNDGDSVRLAMPIHKVDVAKRQVSGWASLDNIDQHSDLVDAAASREAFATFRGNIREQHDEKKAVGRLVDFKEDTLYANGKFYQGVYVTAYVSKGAEDTWQKVLDGTLSGFSIGGAVLESKNDIDPDTGTPFRRVTKYMLTELSLVDNPANQLSNIDSIAKVIGVAPAGEGVTLSGDLADITVENVFVCNDCLGDGHGVHKSSTESLVCPICDGAMIKIGFVESSDPDPRETIQKMVDNHLADREGGVNETMAEENLNNENEEVATTTEVEEVVTTEAPAEEEAATEETTVETVEVEEVADPMTEAINQLRDLTNRIESSSAARAEEVEELKKSLSELDRSFDERLNAISGKVDGLQTRQEEFSKKFEGIDASISEVKKGLMEVDASTALKKSVDFDQSPEEEKSENEKGFWAGSFLNTESL